MATRSHFLFCPCVSLPVKWTSSWPPLVKTAGEQIRCVNGGRIKKMGSQENAGSPFFIQLVASKCFRLWLRKRRTFWNQTEVSQNYGSNVLVLRLFYPAVLTNAGGELLLWFHSLLCLDPSLQAKNNCLKVLAFLASRVLNLISPFSTCWWIVSACTWPFITQVTVYKLS